MSPLRSTLSGSSTCSGRCTRPSTRKSEGGGGGGAILHSKRLSELMTPPRSERSGDLLHSYSEMTPPRSERERSKKGGAILHSKRLSELMTPPRSERERSKKGGAILHSKCISELMTPPLRFRPLPSSSSSPRGQQRRCPHGPHPPQPSCRLPPVASETRSVERSEKHERVFAASLLLGLAVEKEERATMRRPAKASEGRRAPKYCTQGLRAWGQFE